MKASLAVLVASLLLPWGAARAGAPVSNGAFYGAAGGGIGSGATVFDDNLLCLGTDCDYWLEYNTGGTQFELWTTDADGGGSDGLVLTISDGTDDVTFSGAVDIVGASTAGNYTSDGFFVANAFSYIGFNGRTSFKAPAAGQIQVLTWTGASGFTLDADDADNTLTLKDRAGTGNGNLTVTGTTTQSGAQARHFVSIDADDTPYTALATDLVIVCDPDSGGTPGDTTISLPASAGVGREIRVKNIGTTYDCLVDPNGTEQIDASGAGTAVTIDTKEFKTFRDIGVSGFEWQIE